MPFNSLNIAGEPTQEELLGMAGAYSTALKDRRIESQYISLISVMGRLFDPVELLVHVFKAGA